MIALLLVSFGALARPHQEPAPPPQPKPQSAPQAPAGDKPTAQRLRALVRDVELNLRAIDVQLSDAAAGDAPLTGTDSGLAKLLELTQQKSRDVVRDIDAILSLAQQMKQKQGSGGSGGQPQSQRPEDGEQDSNRQQRPRDGRMQRETTPQQHSPRPQQGQEPRDGRQTQQSTPEQQRGAQLPPRPPPGKGVAREDSRQTWGELPDLVREVFNAQGSSDLPIHYREWIDQYWERLRTTAR